MLSTARCPSHRSFTRIAAVLATAGCAGAATSSLAQCPVTVSGMPDFDQRRQGDLPGDGGMYCVPTSVVNIFAYFANRGIPQPGTLAGPRWWQSNLHYDRVSDTLELMGSLMGTTAAGGTGGSGGHAGAFIYSIAFAQGKVSVVHHWCGGGSYCPTPGRLFLAHIQGGFVAPCYGRYTESPANFFTRTGGHCITMNGLDACAPTLSFRDPASDGTNTTQSVFQTHTAGLVQRVGFFRGNSNQAYSIDARYEINYGGGASRRFLDGWYVLYPLVCLTNDQAQPPKIKLLRPFVLAGSGLPTLQEFNAPAGAGAIKGIAIHPQQTDYFYMAGGATGLSKVFQLDPVSGASMEKLSAPGLGLMTFNRHGELFITDGTSLKRYDMETSPPTMIGEVALTAIPEALAVDDEGDGVAVILPSGVPTRKFLNRYQRDLSGPAPGGGLLPPAVAQALQGEVSMAFADGSVLVAAGSDSAALFIMSSDAGDPLLTQAVELPQGSRPMAVNIDVHGHIFYTSNGVMEELMEIPGAGWGPNPDSIFDGLPGGNLLYLARSSTNHLPELHEGPGFVNLLDPEIAPGVQDCYANCDESTVPPILNVDDFTCFINAFAAASSLPRLEQAASYANCDQSMVHPVLNVDDFTCFINAFAAGCP